MENGSAGEPADLVTEPAEALAEGLETASGAEPEAMTVVQSGIAPVSPDEVSETEVGAVASNEGAGLAEPVAEGVAPVSEAPPGQDSNGAAAVAAPAGSAEPILIEVWRLHRQHREPRHAGRGRERPGVSEQRDARGGRPPHRRPHPDRPQSEPSRHRHSPEQGEAGPQGAKASRGGRPEGRRGPPRDQRGAEGRRDKGQEAHRHEPRRHDERRDKPPDPNSPFAKLLALKAQLERRDGDKP
jgi:ATP-dependent RNA helicase SUPV3L1/SUV3